MIAAAVAATAGLAMQSPVPPVVSATGWTGQGRWLRADFHTHTQFSDGTQSIETVVAQAAKHGCDVVAITDHTDRVLKAGRPEFFDAIRAARARHPEITVIAGMEWNVPPGQGTEHATILFPAEAEDVNVFGRFKDRFDDRPKNVPPAEPAVAGLASLMPTGGQALAPVVFINHPSRFPDTASAPKLTFEALHAAAPSILIGIEGGPGHQRASPLGSYPAGVMTGRWDPLVAQIGGVWDQWLRNGLNISAAIANSDFHDEGRGDFWPCEFASTWVYAPDRTVGGIIRAMRGGSFFAEHGHIVSTAELQATARAGSKATVSLRIGVPPTDYLARANRIDTVELIAITKDSAEVLYSGPPSTPAAFSVDVTVPRGGIVVRARGRRNIEGEPALEFYTNPIRIGLTP